jgi:hypothetical protein
MAIVINGSGTVTGLSVGGLPDGTVANVDSKLTGALPAISAANLTAIPAANITGTLPAISGANLTGISAGKVLQLKSMRTGATNFNNSSGTVTLDSLTFSNAHTSGNGVFIGYPLTTYATSRAAEYPSIADQLDDIYHNGIDAWKATIKTTKDKYPKP